MAKVNFTPFGSSTLSVTQLNTVLQTFADAINSNLCRTGGEAGFPNQMEADLDMNFNQILNASVDLSATLTLYTTTEILTNDLSDLRGVLTVGYATQGDGGGAFWTYTGNTVGGSAGTTDFPNKKIYDVNGKEFILNEELPTPQMFGAVADGVTDDSAAIQIALNLGKCRLKGTYAIATTLSLPGSSDITDPNQFVFDSTALICLTEDMTCLDVDTEQYIHIVANGLRCRGADVGGGS